MSFFPKNLNPFFGYNFLAIHPNYLISLLVSLFSCDLFRDTHHGHTFGHKVHDQIWLIWSYLGKNGHIDHIWSYLVISLMTQSMAMMRIQGQITKNLTLQRTNQVTYIYG